MKFKEAINEANVKVDRQTQKLVDKCTAEIYNSMSKIVDKHVGNISSENTKSDKDIYDIDVFLYGVANDMMTIISGMKRAAESSLRGKK